MPTQSPAVVQRRTLRVQGLPCPAPKEDHHKVQSHFNGPISRRAQIPKLKRLAALVSLCRFRAIFRPGPRPTFGPRPAGYDLSPFSDRFNTPQRGPRPLIRSVPGRYDLSPFVDLSIAPQIQAAPASSRHRPPGKTLSTIQSNSYPSLRPPPPRGKGAGRAPKDDHHKVQSHFNGPASAVVQRPQGVGAGLALLDGGVGAPG